MQHFLPHPYLFDAIGIVGFSLYVLNYTMLSLRLVSGDALRYFVLNLVASSCVLISLIDSFNLPSALIQIFWITLSLVAIAIRLLRFSRKSLTA